MQPLDFTTLLDVHLHMQSGCYVSGVTAGTGTARFLWSDTIAEPGFNLAVGTDDPAWVRTVSAGHERAPAILAKDDEEAGRLAARTNVLGAFATRWMTRDTEPAAALPHGLSLDTETGSPPGPRFLSVCGRLFADEAANAVAEAVFVPTLRASRAVEGVETHHLTLRDGDAPVACASVYAAGDLAGVYNVGTIAGRQGQGLGTLATRAAIGAAHEAGASTVVLHSAADGPAARLYASLGFIVAAAPTILVLSPA